MPTQSRKTILLATDQQQSVLNALDANQHHPIAYTPYGHRPMENGLLSLLGFNGELPDPLTGHYHLGKGYRQFNPVLMRFNSPDSWSPFGRGGLNAYAYCTGNPINWKDPTGHTLVPASFFDEIFVNLYKFMKGPKSERFTDIVMTTEQHFGGAEKIRMLANHKSTPPDALIARTLSNNKKPTYFITENPSDIATGIKYLNNADKHLRDTLDVVTTNTGLLNPKNPYLKHLNETEIRNLKADLLAHKNELARVISHVSSLRIEGPSRVAGDFNAKDFVDTANRIRDSR
ncbi:RHS repeat-associated core domain protein-containing protein [Pseudomonas sp. GM78]|uniref:RHS repeat-associated core domain-containing protein n=1 Tax=Pseudomonas sp. GM78 TaxID=1144337 RepID=UPI000270A99C|nr:RHS repeat-associated core domain-containing protein [Pseudomonas sp. GM78]EJN30669.1 RHS repeat-associated core domain protein-containing protein [Pseudomonas sp. GM78]